MAMGADKSIHVEVDAATYENLQPLHVAKILSKVAQEEKADIVFTGKQVSRASSCVVDKGRCEVEGLCKLYGKVVWLWIMRLNFVKERGKVKIANKESIVNGN